MKIIYMPPLSDIGDEDKFFSFKFVGMEAQYTYLSDDLSTLCINIHKKEDQYHSDIRFTREFHYFNVTCIP